MLAWTYKNWGALIGVLLVIITAWLGIGVAALAVIGGIVGYFIGKFLDGELDPNDVQAWAQRRRIR